MDAAFLESLLHEDESTTLDFKQCQYPFSGASEEDQAELLKDILGFANAWRRTDAYILIGVQEVRGGRSIVHGITDHLADHSLQQFVNSRTNKPVLFGYEVCSIDGRQIGVIKIEQQSRPIYLKKDFGKLQKDKVYVRHGTSTDPTKPATPDDIYRMGIATVDAKQNARLVVSFQSEHATQVDDLNLKWTAEYCSMPDASEIPFIDPDDYITMPGGRSIRIPSVQSIHERVNERFYHEFALHEFGRRLFRPICLCVTNTGSIEAASIRVELKLESKYNAKVLSRNDYPKLPVRKHGIHVDFDRFRPVKESAGIPNVVKNNDGTTVEVEIPNLQPGRSYVCERFYLGIYEAASLQISGSLYSSNLPEPMQFVLEVSAEVTQTSMAVDELVGLADRSTKRS